MRLTNSRVPAETWKARAHRKVWSRTAQLNRTPGYRNATHAADGGQPKETNTRRFLFATLTILTVAFGGLTGTVSANAASSDPFHPMTLDQWGAYAPGGA